MAAYAVPPESGTRKEEKRDARLRRPHQPSRARRQCQRNAVKEEIYEIISGIFKNNEYQFDAVRCGIALHGFTNHPDLDRKLRPLVSLNSSISQIHKVKKGEYDGIIL